MIIPEFVSAKTVGIGSNLDVIPAPRGIRKVTGHSTIIQGLKARVYKRKEIYKVLGNNLLRVLEEIISK